MIKKADMDNSHGQMVNNIKVIGKMGSKMEWDCISPEMENLVKENGQME